MASLSSLARTVFSRDSLAPLPEFNTMRGAFLAIISLVLLSFNPLRAQISDATQNLPPFGSFAGGNLDTVSLQNGNLHVSIPVLTVKERGRAFTYRFTFDTPTAYATWIVLPKPNISHYVYRWAGGGSAEGVTLPDGPFGFRLSNSLAGHDSCASYYYWNLIDPAGSTHPLDIVTHSPGTNCTGNVPAGPTKDGSGMWVDTSPNPAVIRMKDGTTYVTATSQSLEDSNGNQSSVSSDMLMRNPLSVTSAANTTYTSPAGNTVTGPQYTLWTYADSNGVQQQFRFDYEAVDVYFLDDQYAKPPTYNNFAYLVVSKLTLPTGSSYQFSYAEKDVGELQQITIPTGGSISYGYGAAGSGGFCWEPPPAVADLNPQLTCRAVVTQRTVTQNAIVSTWNYYGVAPGGYGGVAVITDPNGNDEAHTFQCLVQLSGFVSTAVETQVQQYSGCSPANPNCTTPGSVLKTVATAYTYDSTASYFGGIANVRPIQVTTTLDNGRVSQTQTDYETFTDPAGETATRLNPTAFREYDYGSGSPGTLLRQTKYVYGLNSNSAYTNLNIVDRVTQKTVYDGSGNRVAQTTYEYDNYGHANQPMVASGAVQHDANFGTSYATRGNATAVSQWRNTDGALLTTTKQYDDAGNVISSIDPLNNKTSFSFTDSWSNTTCAPSGQGKAYASSITNALNQVTSVTYDSCTGTPASSTDSNSQTTSNSYDLMGRINQVSYPDGGSTSYCYTDVGGTACTQTGPPYQVVAKKAITPSLNEVSTIIYDGLGRVSQTQVNSDVPSTTYTLTTYDAIGRKSQVYNPTRCSTITSNCNSETTWGVTTYNYDALNRVTSVVEQDGSVVTTTYDQTNSNSTGVCSTVTDEAGKSRQSCVDGLARMTGVWEDPGSSPHLNYQTTYQYDALNNLTKVTQNGSNSANARVRTFAYDSLSQLTSASNPESGTILYAYDADGNVITKTAPLPNQTGSSTVTTTSTYDQLNRLTGKTYSDGGVTDPYTPPVQFGYDGNALTGCAIVPPSDTDTYPVGRRNSMCDGSGGTSWTHDTMGRVKQERRAIGKAPVNHYVDYTYNIGGLVSVLQTPPMKQLNYTYNGAARPTQLVDSTDSINFALSGTYAPTGELTGATLGSASGFSGFTVNNAYNNRLQPILLSATNSATSSTVFGECFNFNSKAGVAGPSPCSFPAGSGDNGNIYQIANNRDITRTQTFFYDSLNRITSGESNGTGSTSWGDTYVIDSWGNLTNINPISTQALGQNVQTGPATIQNQLNGFCYDAAGNLVLNTPCPQPPGTAITPTYYFDAENRIVWTSGYRYIYDGDGERVEKCGVASATTACPASGTTGTLYWRGTGSDTLAETDLGGNDEEEYLFFNGQRVARRDTTSTGTTIAVHYYFSDHLGSHGVVENATGTTCEQDIDYYPYGGEENDYCANVAQNYKFTGKERDTESGLDNFGARYYASAMGRFMKPDPNQTSGFEHMRDPQSWNGYSIARNSPLVYVDPDGLNYTVCDTDGKNCADLTNDQYNQYLQSIQGTSTTVNSAGQIQYTNDNGSVTNLGTASYYNEKDIQAAQMLVQTGVTLSDPRTIAGFYGASALLGVGFYAAGAYEAGFTGLELSGGGEILTNEAAGQIIGWGTSQEGAAATEQLTNSLTKKAVQEMVDQGLTKSTVQRLTFQYGRAIAEGGSKLANSQLMPRYELMMKIIELWPK